jgi:hypothetical protein
VVDDGDIPAGEGFTVTIFVAEQPAALVYDIAAVPADTPVTMPLVPTVAMPVAPLLHVPPGVASARVVVAPTHMAGATGGVIAAGRALTVTGAVTKQVPIAYDIVAVPAATPVTTPPATLAVPEALLLHVPPPVAFVKVVVLPTHTAADKGDIAAGVILTVTALIEEQPEAVV